jgi:hypothetical protein
MEKWLDRVMGFSCPLVPGPGNEYEYTISEGIKPIVQGSIKSIAKPTKLSSGLLIWLPVHGQEAYSFRGSR